MCYKIIITQQFFQLKTRFGFPCLSSETENCTDRELLLRHKIIILDIYGGFFSSKALDPVIGLMKVTQLERARFQVSSDVLFFVQSY